MMGRPLAYYLSLVIAGMALWSMVDDVRALIATYSLGVCMAMLFAPRREP